MLRGGLPFSLRPDMVGRIDLVSVALARRAARQSGLSTPVGASPAFTGHPRSVQLGLSSGEIASDHPSLCVLICQRTDPANRIGNLVPKGRFELPRPYGHYALNVARLPVSPLRHAFDLAIASGRSRPPDSNRRPAVYETAALPTELGRQVPSRSPQSNAAPSISPSISRGQCCEDAGISASVCTPGPRPGSAWRVLCYVSASGPSETARRRDWARDCRAGSPALCNWDLEPRTFGFVMIVRMATPS